MLFLILEFNLAFILFDIFQQMLGLVTSIFIVQHGISE